MNMIEAPTFIRMVWDKRFYKMKKLTTSWKKTSDAFICLLPTPDRFQEIFGAFTIISFRKITLSVNTESCAILTNFNLWLILWILCCFEGNVCCFCCSLLEDFNFLKILVTETELISCVQCAFLQISLSSSKYNKLSTA